VWLAIAISVALGAMGGARAERRVALVIGNGKYQHAQELVNPGNDARAIADMLTQVGFDVVDFRQDVGVVEFKRAVREFMTQAANSDIAIVYYSGHGMEFDGSNYLIPVDAKLASTFDVDDETVSLERILAATQQVRKLSLIILDACRDSPFLRGTKSMVATRAISSGLTGVAPTAANTLVAYAAKAGSVSFDGVGPNSPFTTALIKHLAEPGLDIRIALGKVRDEVMTETGGQQEPFVYGSLGGENVTIVPAKSIGDAVAASLEGGGTPEALDYQLAERVGSLEAWRAFVDAHPEGYYSKLALAQIAKLSAASGSGAPTPTASPVASVNKTTAPPTVAPPAAGEKAPPVIATREDLCKQDRDTLLRLRAIPLAEDVDRFAMQLKCEELRPQVMRLMESVGAPQAPPTKSAETDTRPRPAASGSCDAEIAELSRLRANPDRKQAQAFADSLTCAALRPQAQRLLESLAQ
jgi:hypothetical protein